MGIECGQPVQTGNRTSLVEARNRGCKRCAVGIGIQRQHLDATFFQAFDQRAADAALIRHHDDTRALAELDAGCAADGQRRSQYRRRYPPRELIRSVHVARHYRRRIGSCRGLGRVGFGGG